MWVFNAIKMAKSRLVAYLGQSSFDNYNIRCSGIPIGTAFKSSEVWRGDRHLNFNLSLNLLLGTVLSPLRLPLNPHRTQATMPSAAAAALAVAVANWPFCCLAMYRYLQRCSAPFLPCTPLAPTNHSVSNWSYGDNCKYTLEHRMEWGFYVFKHIDLQENISRNSIYKTYSKYLVF